MLNSVVARSWVGNLTCVSGWHHQWSSGVFLHPLQSDTRDSRVEQGLHTIQTLQRSAFQLKIAHRTKNQSQSSAAISRCQRWASRCIGIIWQWFYNSHYRDAPVSNYKYYPNKWKNIERRWRERRCEGTNRNLRAHKFSGQNGGEELSTGREVTAWTGTLKNRRDCPLWKQSHRKESIEE